MMATVEAWLSATTATNGDVVIIAVMAYFVLHLMFGTDHAEIVRIAQDEIKRAAHTNE